jgi:hypothetical protein
MDKKLALSIAVSIVVMFLVYLGLQDSLNRPSIGRLPISSEIAISIVMQEQKKNNKDFNQTDLNDFSTRYVYLKGDGNIFASDIKSNSIGRYLDKTEEPTITTGNHFVWEVKDEENNYVYYIDHVSGEIILKSKYT